MEQSLRNQFKNFIAQTSKEPMGLEIVKAKGVYLFDSENKKYIDLISGISVSNYGHGNEKIISAIKKQADDYLHTMVYGEHILKPQILLAQKLAALLNNQFSSFYFVNSGSEAIEGAIKLAKRSTHRPEIVSFNNSYHGSTTGALSLGGNEERKNAFRPLIPGNVIINYNSIEELNQITTDTAAVVIEPIQSEAGVILPNTDFLNFLIKKCKETKTLIIADEVQTGIGRTGSFCCFQQLNFTPDILCLSKALGAGVPLGVFASSAKLMESLTSQPVLGHITTYGGNPLCCAAAEAGLTFLEESCIMTTVADKEKMFLKFLRHKAIKQVRSKGLLIAIEFDSENFCKQVIEKCIENGVIVDWFLFCSSAIRLAPPLIISESEIKEACSIIVHAIEYVSNSQDLA